MRFHKTFGTEQPEKLPCLLIIGKTFPIKKSIKKMETFCRALIGLYALQFLFLPAFVKALIIVGHQGTRKSYLIYLCKFLCTR